MRYYSTSISEEHLSVLGYIRDNGGYIQAIKIKELVGSELLREMWAKRLILPNEERWVINPKFRKLVEQ